MTRNIDYGGVPIHMQQIAREYIEMGVPPGDFMFELFSNKLVQAFAAADDTNTARMLDWARFIFNEAPLGCWGSEEKVEEWIEAGGLLGGAATKKRRKEEEVEE